MFENDLFYIDYRERKKVVLQLPMLSVERDDEGDLKTTFGIEGQGSESVLLTHFRSPMYNTLAGYSETRRNHEPTSRGPLSSCTSIYRGGEISYY